MTVAEQLSSGAPMTGLSHAQLLVSDVPASAEWYAAALGLEPYAEDPALGYVALRHRGAKVVFVLTSRPAARSRASMAGVSTTWPSPYLTVTPCAAWADHLTEIGIEHAGVVLENGNPSLQLRDPDGIAIELVAPGPRSGRRRSAAVR